MRVTRANVRPIGVVDRRARMLAARVVAASISREMFGVHPLDLPAALAAAVAAGWLTPGDAAGLEAPDPVHAQLLAPHLEVPTPDLGRVIFEMAAAALERVAGLAHLEVSRTDRAPAATSTYTNVSPRVAPAHGPTVAA